MTIYSNSFIITKKKKLILLKIGVTYVFFFPLENFEKYFPKVVPTRLNFPSKNTYDINNFHKSFSLKIYTVAKNNLRHMKTIIFYSSIRIKKFKETWPYLPLHLLLTTLMTLLEKKNIILLSNFLLLNTSIGTYILFLIFSVLVLPCKLRIGFRFWNSVF